MEFYRRVVSPVLDRLDSETMHVAARRALHLAESVPGGLGLRVVEKFGHEGERFTDDRLRVNLGGIELDNPVMVGAGWDKVGESVMGLYVLGASGVEIGAVLPWEQPGNNPKDAGLKARQWFHPTGVADNWLGFNAPGMVKVIHNLERYQNINIPPIGINLGKNKETSEEDAPFAYAAVVRRLYPYASYFSINVSSPNTPGLRDYQRRDPIRKITEAVLNVQEQLGSIKPTFIKTSPDTTEEQDDDLIEVCLNSQLAGFVIANTTIDPEIKARYDWQDLPGGLSGDDPWYREKLVKKTARFRRAVKRDRYIVGAGAISNVVFATERILAGADALQIVTALRSEGPKVFGKINRRLINWMNYHGVSDLAEMVGIDSEKIKDTYPVRLPPLVYSIEPAQLEALRSGQEITLKDKNLTNQTLAQLMGEKGAAITYRGDFAQVASKNDQEDSGVVVVTDIRKVHGLRGDLIFRYMRDKTWAEKNLRQ